MFDNIRSPQLFIIGAIKQAYNFTQYQQGSIFLKYQILTGQNWKILNGQNKGQTFNSLVIQQYATLQHPIDLHYATESIRGWPRLNIQVWIIDQHSKTQLGGYATLTIPFKSGFHQFNLKCWRPKSSWTEMGANKQLLYPGVLLSSQSRFGFMTQSTGYVKLDIWVMAKDFNLHGVKLA